MYLFLLTAENVAALPLTFTFQNVSISTVAMKGFLLRFLHLHSKMYLFLREQHGGKTAAGIFTFQNVSISTPSRVFEYFGEMSFTFQNVSISTRF